MQQFAEAVNMLEDGLQHASDGCLRSELVNRCFLSSLYEAQLASRSTTTLATTCIEKTGPCGAGLDQGSDLLLKAMRNLERATLLAANLHEFEVLTFCAISLADLQISRRDLAAAGATFDSCVRVCATIAQSPLRTSLMQRLLPKSMEVCNMQGRTADSFARLRLLHSVLASSGQWVAEDCPLCGEAFAHDRSCLALGCGHCFHRDCCDCWMGRTMFKRGAFCAECPVCSQVDWSLKPTPAASQALEEYKATYGVSGSASGSNAGSQASGESCCRTGDISSSGGERPEDDSGRSTNSISGSTVQGRHGKSAGAWCLGSESSSSSCSDSESGSDYGMEDAAQSDLQ